MKAKRVAIYLRVSTKSQTTENQLIKLMEVVERANWKLYKVYEDEGVSGSKGRDERPGFDSMLKDAIKRRFDMIAVWSIDRLGRSVDDLITFLKEIHSVNCDLYIDEQGIDTTTPAGKVIFQMLSIFAEFERAIIQERVIAGLNRARANGVKLGRAKISRDIELEIISLRESAKPKMGILKIAKKLGLGTGTVHRVIKEHSNIK